MEDFKINAEPIAAGDTSDPGDSSAFANALDQTARPQPILTAGLFGLGSNQSRVGGLNKVSVFTNRSLPSIDRDLPSETQQELRSLRNLVNFQGGVTQDIADRIEANPDIKWNDVLEPGIYMVSAGINQVGGAVQHRHYLRIGQRDEPAQIINAGPLERPNDAAGNQQTQLATEVMDFGTVLNNDRIGSTWEMFQVQTGADVDVDQLWGGMQETARDIGAAGWNYNFTQQNSNSVAGTIAARAGLSVAIGGAAPGWGNDLSGELTGRDQAPSNSGRISSPGS